MSCWRSPLESSAPIADSGGPIRPPMSRPLYPLYSSLCLPLLYPRHTLINDISHYVVVRNRLRKSSGGRLVKDGLSTTPCSRPRAFC